MGESQPDLPQVAAEEGPTVADVLDVDDPVERLRDVVATALEADPVAPLDSAVARLALTYASEIDSGGDLAKLGPALLAALEALHMSPRARAVARRGVNGVAVPFGGELDELRERRARKDPTADTHAGPS